MPSDKATIKETISLAHREATIVHSMLTIPFQLQTCTDAVFARCRNKNRIQLMREINQPHLNCDIFSKDKGGQKPQGPIFFILCLYVCYSIVWFSVIANEYIFRNKTNISRRKPNFVMVIHRYVWKLSVHSNWFHMLYIWTSALVSTCLFFLVFNDQSVQKTFNDI